MRCSRFVSAIECFLNHYIDHPTRTLFFMRTRSSRSLRESSRQSKCLYRISTCFCCTGLISGTPGSVLHLTKFSSCDSHTPHAGCASFQLALSTQHNTSTCCPYNAADNDISSHARMPDRHIQPSAAVSTDSAPNPTGRVQSRYGADEVALPAGDDRSPRAPRVQSVPSSSGVSVDRSDW